MAYKYGLNPAHPEETHPRVHLASHLTDSAPVPNVIDWYSKVGNWPMLLNDQLGDCTCAGYLHLRQAWTTFASNTYTPTDNEALSLYETVAGYNPTTGANDNGAVIQDVLADLAQKGEDGRKIAAFAQVDHTNHDEVLKAANAFGGLYLGIACPASAQTQFAEGEQSGTMPVLDYDASSPIEGGHCIVLVGWDGTNYLAVTWGALVKLTPAFWDNYVTEAWAIATQDFIEKSGDDPLGVNLATLITEFNQFGLQAYQTKAENPVEELVQDVVKFFKRYF